MKTTFTPEQRNVITSAVDVLLVQAFAGTGKTTTLVQFAVENPNLRILYLAFSKAIQLSAVQRFPSNVTAKTTHALAWGRFGAAYKQAGKLGFVNARDLMRLFDIEPRDARLVLSTVERFIQSADERLGDTHVPGDLVNKGHRARVGELAGRAWETMKDKADDRLKMPHDGYFKLFQLSKPDLSLDYDVILGDEWQDTNPVTHALVSAQQCRLVFVGDTHQSIFAFRGATNAMREVHAEFSRSERTFEMRRLTHSFRFGKGIADLGTTILAALKGEKHPLIGRGQNESVWTVDRNLPYTVIARSNGTLFAEVVALLGRAKFHLIGLEEDRTPGNNGGMTYAPFEKLVDVHHALTGQQHLVRDAFIKGFKSAGQLEEYASATEDKELMMLMKISKEYGRNIPSLVARIKAEVERDGAGAHVTLTTAHRSKGLEFDQVVLTSDFEEFIGDDGRLKRATTQDLAQEANLLYVASTRALRALETNRQIKEIEAVLKREGFVLPKEQAPAPQATNAPRAAAPAAAAAPAQAGANAPSPVLHSPEQAAAQAIETAKASAQPAVALAGTVPTAPRDFYKRAIKDQVQHAILIEGLLDLGELAAYLGRTRGDAIRVLGNLVAAGNLSARLFAHEPAIAAVAAAPANTPAATGAFL